MLREKLFSLLSLLISDSKDVWASFVVLYIESLEDQKMKKVIKLDSEIKKIRKQGIKMMKKLRSSVTVPSNLPSLTSSEQKRINNKIED